MPPKNFLYLLSVLLCMFNSRINANLIVSPATPSEMVLDLVGPGISTSNISYTGARIAAGRFDGSQSTIGIHKGILLTTGSIYLAPGPNTVPNASGFNNLQGDTDLDHLVTYEIFDATTIEFDFVPISDNIAFQFVFASEEYREYVNNEYNDVFGFFLSGPGINGPFTNKAINLAVIPGTQIPMSVNTINHVTNTSYYIDNPENPASSIQYDGFTKIITANHTGLTPGETYHFKLSIGDGDDHLYDAAVFFKFGSFTSLPSVKTLKILGSPFCAGSAILIPFIGTHNFNSDNIFTAQLSQPTGSFDPPITIGSIASSSSGIINGYIPKDLSGGTGYRIRVISSSPATVGEDNGENLAVFVPKAMCKNITLDLNASGYAIISPFDVYNGLSDLCIQSMEVSPNRFTCNEVGQNTVTLTVKDINGYTTSCQSIVTIRDTTTPALLISLTPQSLWPPNHKMVTINASVSSQGLCDKGTPLTYVLTSITSNEPDNGFGDGDKPHDIQNAALGTSDFQFSLRAERSGIGSGRIYTITYKAIDNNGNSTTASTFVTVQHNP